MIDQVPSSGLGMVDITLGLLAKAMDTGNLGLLPVEQLVLQMLLDLEGG